MKIRPIAFAAVFVAAILVAIALNTIYSVKSEASAEIEKLFDDERVTIFFDSQHYRGVICGRYQIHDSSGIVISRPFIYVSHYSAESPNTPLLFARPGEVTPDRQAHFGC